MPRDITILSPEEPDALDLAVAARAVDESLGVREIDAGDALQVFDASGEQLLTVYGARRLDVPGEVERLLPAPPSPALPVFWIDAVAPLDDRGDMGVSVALRLALGLDAACVVED